jgi:hypothetical protein
MRAGDQLLEVSWEPPISGDPYILDYRISVSPPDVGSFLMEGPGGGTATVHGLTNGTSYTVTITAIAFSGQTASEPSLPATPAPPLPTSLSLAASRGIVAPGVRVWLTGTLRGPGGSPLGGETVLVEHRRRGTTNWIRLTATTSRGDGQVGVQVAPTTHVHYRLRHPATPFYGASVSRLVVILAGSRITSRLAPGRIVLGRTATLSGTAFPVARGKLLALQQKVGRSWRTVRRTRSGVRGRYVFTLRPARAGSTWWRVSKASDAVTLSAASPAWRLKVLPKPKPKPRPKPKPKPSCDPSYPDFCIPPGVPDLDCSDIPWRNFAVLPPDPHNFDGDNDGVGCES